MKYDFSNTSLELREFIDAYTACVTIHDGVNISTITGLYEQVFELLSGEFEESDFIHVYERIAHYKIEKEIPYSIVANEIHGLKNFIINHIEDNHTIDLVKLLKLFQKTNNVVAHIYLLEYIEKLIAQNSMRINSIADLVEKNIIYHYESHLLWLNDLALHIKERDKVDFPELNERSCKFGVWLNGDAKETIANSNKHMSIVNLHKNLHLFASKIFNLLDKNEYHILITYLEKCELISLSIGTELALLDQILINKMVTKDTLTGALNRHSLHSVFESQYDLALATGNPFILAMCDLDFFKNINDTYGHVAGDKLLKSFVECVKENIRNSDVIIRYGGEEFIIILPTIHKEKGYEILDKIRAAFAEHILLFNGEKVSTTVSIGMMEVEPDRLFKRTFLDEYIMIVDKKLYEAKESGRNRVELF